MENINTDQYNAIIESLKTIQEIASNARKATVDKTREINQSRSITASVQNHPITQMTGDVMNPVPHPYQKTLFQECEWYLKSDTAPKPFCYLTFRGSGATYCMTSVAFWYANNSIRQKVVLVSPTRSEEKVMSDMIRAMVDSIPSGCNLPTSIDKNHRKWRFPNGSVLELDTFNNISTSEHGAVHHYDADVLIINGAGFIPHKTNHLFETLIEEVCEKRSGKVILSSVPSMRKGVFHDYAMITVGSRLCLHHTYEVHPTLDEKWASEMIKSIGQDKFDQEYRGYFVN